MSSSPKLRSASLDTLRGIAVLLVLSCHMPFSETIRMSIDRPSPQEAIPEWLAFPLITLQTGGWVGVDLFFVLSGFLVSGLLFREWQASEHLRVTRFLIRRGFKIYPAFYAMIAVTFSILAWKGKWLGWQWVIPEILFVQNYWPNAIPHTWSLAVEEHFYLALPLILLCCRGSKQAPFRALPVIVLFISAACLTLRLVQGANAPMVAREHYVPTHLRCDSLFFGVFLSWLHHFRRPAWDWMSDKLTPYLPLLALAGFAPAFIWKLEECRALTTWGLTGLYLSAGALLVWFLKRHLSSRPLAYIGFYSYSIYLWHIAFARIAVPWILGPDANPYLTLGLYFTLAIAGGILLARLIELPALKLREQFAP